MWLFFVVFVGKCGGCVVFLEVFYGFGYWWMFDSVGWVFKVGKIDGYVVEVVGGWCSGRCCVMDRYGFFGLF